MRCTRFDWQGHAVEGTAAAVAEEIGAAARAAGGRWRRSPTPALVGSEAGAVVGTRGAVGGGVRRRGAREAARPPPPPPRRMSPPWRAADGGYVVVHYSTAKLLECEHTLTTAREPLAPEQVKGGGHGLAADLWALGVLLYESHAGRCPFGAVGEAGGELRVYAQITLSTKLASSVLPRARRPRHARAARRAADAGGRRPPRRRRRRALRSHAWFGGVDWSALGGRRRPSPLLAALGGRLAEQAQHGPRTRRRRSARSTSAVRTRPSPLISVVSGERGKFVRVNLHSLRRPGVVSRPRTRRCSWGRRCRTSRARLVARRLRARDFALLQRVREARRRALGIRDVPQLELLGGRRARRVPEALATKWACNSPQQVISPYLHSTSAHAAAPR